jgi:hypothetical protein
MKGKRCVFSEKRKGSLYKCKLNTCKSTLCWIHGSKKGLELDKGEKFKYRIKKSLIKDAGLGLFYKGESKE